MQQLSLRCNKRECLKQVFFTLISCIIEGGIIEIIKDMLDVTTETEDEIVETVEHELGVTAEIEDEIVETMRHVMDVIVEAEGDVILEVAKHMVDIG